MLNLDVCRAIKPIGSVDDYESGLTSGETNQQKRERLVLSILNLLKETPFKSVNEIVLDTGASQAGIHGIMTSLFGDGLVIREPKRTKGAVKPAWFYSLPE